MAGRVCDIVVCIEHGRVSFNHLGIDIQVSVNRGIGVNLEDFLGWFWPEHAYQRKGKQRTGRRRVATTAAAAASLPATF